MSHIVVVGAGLAGCEAAWTAANAGADVTLIEMKPDKYTPAHTSPDFAELVLLQLSQSKAGGNRRRAFKTGDAAAGLGLYGGRTPVRFRREGRWLSTGNCFPRRLPPGF